MAQYLMALLGNRNPSLFGLGDSEVGRMGDYVFNQEGSFSLLIRSYCLDELVALDEIITNLMENSNATRPVPATEEIIDKLNREVLETGCT